MPRCTGFNHLALATGDLEATIRFWRDLVGLPLVASLGKPGARQYFFSAGGGAYLGFFEWPGVEPIPEKDHGYPVRGPFGFDHLALGVASPEDLWALRDALDAAGFWVSEPLDHGFIHSIYSFDPNGIAIEFSCPVDGVDLEARPRLVDRDPGPAALEGPQPQPGHWPPVNEPTRPEDRRVYPGEGRAFIELPSRD